MNIYHKLKGYVLLSKRMEFGTTGLRAAMGAGYCKMNDLTVIQASQGFEVRFHTTNQ